MNPANRRPSLVDELYAEAAEFLSRRPGDSEALEPVRAEGQDASASADGPGTRVGPLPAESPRLQAAR